MYWQVWAVIKNGVVQNRVVGTQTQVAQLVSNVYGADASFVCVSTPVIPVEIGDRYDGTDFYHNGVKIASHLTSDEEVERLCVKEGVVDSEIDDINDALVDIVKDMLGG